LREWIKEKRERGGKRLSERQKVVAGLGAAVLGIMVVGGYGMLWDTFPMLQGMEYVDAAKFLACEAIGVCQAPI